MSADTMSTRNQATSDPAHHQCPACGAVINTDRYVCSGCMSVTVEFLRAYWYREPTPYGLAPNLFDELTTTATRGARMTPANDGSRPTERPLPFNTHAAQVLNSDVHYLVTSAHHYGVPTSITRVRNGAMCARWLGATMDVIAGRDDAGLFVDTIADRYQRAMSTIDRPPDTWYAGKCLGCHAHLYALDGSTRINCTTCNAVHDVADQRARLLAAVEDTLATAHEICGAVHLLDRAVTRSQIDNWFSRGQLLRRGVNLGGHFTYRVGDVLDLVARR